MHQGLSVINKRQYKKVINKWVVLVSVVGIIFQVEDAIVRYAFILPTAFGC